MNKLDFNEDAELLKLLGHPIRLCIVAGLIEEEGGCNVTTIHECLGVPQSTISQHLALLKAHGILISTRKGTEMCYSVCSDMAKQIVALLLQQKSLM